jgi:hypothetical protein
MANLFAGDRFVIDTAGTTLLRATLAPGTSMNLRIGGLHWVGATTIGHGCVIQDSDSVALWSAVAKQANDDVVWDVPLVWQKDFKVTTLASGLLYVYLDVGHP